MDTDKGLSLTSLLAAYGATLSSITFGWTLFRDLRDRASLKVIVRVRRIGVGLNGMGFAVSPSVAVAGASQELYLVVRVVNVGRRPMLWEGWGGKYIKPQHGKSSFFIVGANLPKMLNERESHSERTTLSDANITNVETFYVWDASGKHWQLSRKQMKSLRAEAAEATKENNSPSADDEWQPGETL
jgi:hypothetical protein